MLIIMAPHKVSGIGLWVEVEGFSGFRIYLMMDKLSGSCQPTVRHAVSPSILDRFSIKSRRSSFEYSQSAQKLRPEQSRKPQKPPAYFKYPCHGGCPGWGCRCFAILGLVWVLGAM